MRRCGQQGRTPSARDAVIEAGGWKEGMSGGEDHELWLRMARLGPVAMVPQPVVEHLLHSGQSMTRIAEEQWSEEFMNRERGWRQDFVRRLPSAERDEGVRILRGWERLRAGDKPAAGGRYSTALREYLGAIQARQWPSAHAVLRPLIFPRTQRAFAGAIVRFIDETFRKTSPAGWRMAEEVGTLVVVVRT